MDERTILIVEDDKSIQNVLKISLKANGYKTLTAETGEEGISLYSTAKCELILLDLGLPDMDGCDVLKRIRQSSEIPVIIISARGQEKEKIVALDFGADDYITKPFSIEELLARVRAQLRHKGIKKEQESVFIVGDLRVDFEKRRVYTGEDEVHLTPLEYKMLGVLIENVGRVVTHKYIQKEVWGYATGDDYQSLRVFMANIRRKIERDTSKPRYIITEVGVGYRLAEE